MFARVNVIQGGDDAFNALLYPEQLEVNRGYFVNQINQLANTVSNTASSFYQRTQALYDQLNSSEAARIAKNALRAVNGLFTSDVIYEMTDIDRMQLAKPTMQRFIMANPKVRSLWNEGLLDGYSDSYVDINPGTISDTHYDYRRIMDGVVMETADSYSVNFYPDELRPNEIVITHNDKICVLDTWRNIEALIEQGLDPTNQFA